MKTCSLRLSLYISLQFEIIGFTKNYIVYTGFFLTPIKLMMLPVFIYILMNVKTFLIKKKRDV